MKDQKTTIRNKEYRNAFLVSIYHAYSRVRNLVDEYRKDPNCSPDLWIRGEEDNSNISEVEVASFIYHGLIIFNK